MVTPTCAARPPRRRAPDNYPCAWGQNIQGLCEPREESRTRQTIRSVNNCQNHDNNKSDISDNDSTSDNNNNIGDNNDTKNNTQDKRNSKKHNGNTNNNDNNVSAPA